MGHPNVYQRWNMIYDLVEALLLYKFNITLTICLVVTYFPVCRIFHYFKCLQVIITGPEFHCETQTRVR